MTGRGRIIAIRHRASGRLYRRRGRMAEVIDLAAYRQRKAAERLRKRMLVMSDGLWWRGDGA